jgi:hypothetical protein
MDYGRLASLYRQYLGRDPEPGAEGWLQYDDGTIESGIANSEEANNFRNQSGQQQQPQPEQQQPQAPSGLDDNAIRQLYQQYLGRDADAGGLNTWRGQSYEQVLQGILGSGEYAQRITSQQPAKTPETQQPQSGLNDAQVKQLYNRYLGRDPDPDGMNTFRGMDAAQAIRTIATSREFLNKQDAKQAAASTDIGQYGFTFDINNPQNGAVKTDRSGGRYTFTYANGASATFGDYGLPWAQMIESVSPAISTYEDPANMRLGYRNYAYAGSTAPDEITIDGNVIPVKKQELLLNAQGKVFTDPTKGNRTYTIQEVSPQQKDSQTYQVFGTIIQIGAAIIASAAFAPVGMAILESATAMTAAELTAAYGATAVNAAASAISAGGSSALNTALQGGDFNKIAEAAAIASATAGATSGISSEINAALPKDLPATASGALARGTTGSVTALLSGKDPLTGGIRGAISGAVGGAVKDIQTNDYDLQGDDQVFDTEEQRYLTPYEVSVKYPELYPEGLPVEERTVGERLAGTTATTLAGALSSYFFPSTKPSTGGTRTSGREPTPSTGAKTVPRETTQTTARSPTAQPAPMMSTSSASPSTSSYFGPSTAALGQALNIGNAALASGGGGDQGSSGQELSEESGAAPKKKWVNAQSLRDLDEIGS